MVKRTQKREKIDFLLESKHYKRLHLLLYITSLTAIVMVYFLSIIIFSGYANLLITGIFSLVTGVTIFFNRDKIVKKISEFLNERKIKKNKQSNKDGLKSTLKNISPKRKFKLNISKETSFKEKITHFKKKLNKKENPKKKQKKEYIEIKE